MKLMQTLGSMNIKHEIRKRLEGGSFFDLRNARCIVKHHLPNHLVYTEGDRIVVANKDKSIRVAEFKMIGDPQNDYYFNGK